MAGETCLLLTATIQVEHPEFLRAGGRIDTSDRLHDYATALRAWIVDQHTVGDIVFVDNSGYPLDALREVVDRHAAAGKRVELISCRTTGYSATHGRSYGELDLMDQALRTSVLLGEHARFAKVTGRVFIPNFDAIMTAVAADFDIVGRLSHNLTWLDTVFVLFRRTLFAEQLLPYALARVNDQTRHHVERVLASACLHGIAEGCRWYPFPVEPRIRGVRGLDGRPYPASALRSAAIDFFAWGHHRVLDVVSNSARPHPQARWSAGSPATASPKDTDSGD